HDERKRKARLANVAAEGHIVWAAGLEQQHRQEGERDRNRCPDPEVGALLGEQLQELPLVDARNPGHAATSVTRSRPATQTDVRAKPAHPGDGADKRRLTPPPPAIRSGRGRALRGWPSARRAP